MSEDAKPGCVAAVLLIFAIVAGVAEYVIGKNAGYAQAQKEAIEHHVAYWAIDSTTGEKSFVWGSK